MRCTFCCICMHDHHKIGQGVKEIKRRPKKKRFTLGADVESSFHVTLSNFGSLLTLSSHLVLGVVHGVLQIPEIS